VPAGRQPATRPTAIEYIYRAILPVSLFARTCSSARARAAERAAARRRGLERTGAGPERIESVLAVRRFARRAGPEPGVRAVTADGSARGQPADAAYRPGRRPDDRPAPAGRGQAGRTPLGATFDGYGTNFAVFSGVAERVELCLFDSRGGSERTGPGREDPRRGGSGIDLNRGIGQIWHAYLAAGRPGHALRVPRPWPVGSGARPALQPEQAAGRPVRPARISEGLHWGPGAARRRRQGRAVERGQARPTPCARWSSSRTSTGATIAGSRTRGTRPSSTRSTSRA